MGGVGGTFRHSKDSKNIFPRLFQCENSCVAAIKLDYKTFLLNQVAKVFAVFWTPWSRFLEYRDL